MDGVVRDGMMDGDTSGVMGVGYMGAGGEGARWEVSVEQ